ncbi:hypothetical protein CMK21_01115 [Candidatus Poribacteria bacterium]|nr:hypothetical protein [Candidatus Poribacteria bacterium]|tara:strand:+ start:2075 stop:2344 length:270 start_codon:yes stop_codon:yes gene_type:complete
MRTKRLLSRYIFVVSVFCYLLFVFSVPQAQKIIFNFENDASLKGQEIIDESPKILEKEHLLDGLLQMDRLRARLYTNPLTFGELKTTVA